jgi:hypothetical protein
MERFTCFHAEAARDSVQVEFVVDVKDGPSLAGVVKVQY